MKPRVFKNPFAGLPRLPSCVNCARVDVDFEKELQYNSETFARDAMHWDSHLDALNEDLCNLEFLKK